MYGIITRYPPMTSRYIITISTATEFYIMRSGLPVRYSNAKCVYNESFASAVPHKVPAGIKKSFFCAHFFVVLRVKRFVRNRLRGVRLHIQKVRAVFN